MPSALDRAIEALRSLSPARQEELAGFIGHLAVDEREPEEIDPSHLPAVMEGLAQLKRGERATSEQVEGALRSFDE